MSNNAKKKIALVLPMYNASKTLYQTISKIPDYIDELIIVDDASTDNSVKIAKELKLNCIKHLRNIGYGGTQKTGYKEALKKDAEIIIMLHPDGQHNPEELILFIKKILYSSCDLVIGSRFLKECNPTKYGMPIYKFFGHKILNFIGNLFLNTSFTDMHSGYRAFSKRFLKSIPFYKNSNDFNFDEQVIIQCLYWNFLVSEVPVSTYYSQASSSISFFKSVIYVLKFFRDLFLYKVHLKNLLKFKILSKS